VQIFAVFLRLSSPFQVLRISTALLPASKPLRALATKVEGLQVLSTYDNSPQTLPITTAYWLLLLLIALNRGNDGQRAENNDRCIRDT
jgi:hypothetical protein